jgi:hypothetical protein
MKSLAIMDGDLKKIIVSGISPENVCFWTGAGISANKPSNQPLGDSLTQRTVEHFCLPGTWNKLIGYFRQTKMQDAFGYPKNTPRLEAVLESLIQALDLGVLNILDSSYNAKPNLLHYFFAKHLAGGGIHITANFDNCIENALRYLGSYDKVQIINSFESFRISSWGLSNSLIHIHGRYDQRQDSLKHLGVRIRNIASGFPEVLKDMVTSLLCRESYLIFVGYSGRDYFDVNPFFSELKKQGKQLKNLTVIWVKHTPRKEKGELVPWYEQQEGKDILEALENCGTKIFYLLMQADKFLEVLKELFGYSYKVEIGDERDHENGQIIQDLPFISISENEKILATAQLYSSMGIGQEVITLASDLLRIINERIDKHSFSSKIYLLLNNGLRDIGLYKQALKYSCALPTTTLEERMIFDHRIAGDCWLRGDHFRAFYHFYRGIFMHKRSMEKFIETNESITEIYYESIVTFLHWYRDIKKLPLVGKLLPLRWGIKEFQRLMQAKEYLLEKPHDKAKLIRLYDEIPVIKRRVSLPLWIKLAEVEIISYFQETDSILGVVNFSRREIELAIKRGGKIDKSELELLSLRSRIIGDLAGILKAAILQKKIYRTNDPLAKITLRQIEWAWWMKVVWLLKWYWADLKKP